MDIINVRRSVRKFLNKTVELEKIESILRAGMQAPSANNQQPWCFLVVGNRNRLNELSTINPYTKMLTQAPLAIVTFIDKSHLNSLTMVSSDMGAATQNMLLEAVHLGLGACWMGLYLHGISEKDQTLNKIFQAPENLIPYSMIAIGYPQDPNANHFVDRFDSSRVSYEKF